MPQIFQVLRCYECSIFQVHQVKKTNKWQCKLCNEKQSMKRRYALGNSKECRIHVQKLNNLHGSINEQTNSDSDDDCDNTVDNINDTSQHVQLKKASKWDIYKDKTYHDVVESDEDENSMFTGDAKIVLEIPKKRKNMSNTNSYTNKKTLLNTVLEKNSANTYYADKNLNTEKDTLRCHLDNKSTMGVTGKPVKFMPPTKNTNSKWKQYHEDLKCDDDIDMRRVGDKNLLNTYTITNNKFMNQPQEIINQNICNTSAIEKKKMLLFEEYDYDALNM